VKKPRLIVTADDVGLDRGMTEGAIRAHREGVVTACSVVANGLAFDDAVARLREVPWLEVGVHLALVEERSLTTGSPMPKNYIRYLLSRGGLDPEREMRAQIEKVMKSGLRVTHLNGHQHLHMWPRIYAIVERLAKEYGIPYIRRVDDRGGRAGRVRRASIAVLNRFGRRAHGKNDCTIGVAEAGHLTAERIIELLDEVEGITELVTHPGAGVPRFYAHWGYDWDGETAALCDPRVKAAIEARHIKLVAPSQAHV
jgi:chitin disaccharide deacetylase